MPGSGVGGSNSALGGVLVGGAVGGSVISVSGTAHFTFTGTGSGAFVDPSHGTAHFVFTGIGSVHVSGGKIPPGPYRPAANYQPFTYVLCDLRSGAVKGELPMTGVSFGKTLNGVGQFQGTVDLQDANLQLVDPLDLTTPANTALFVDYNGSLVWGGVIGSRARTFAPGSRKMTVTASDLWSYFSQRVQATDYSAPPYSGITGPSTKMGIWDASNTDALSVYDPLLMAWQVVADALTVNPPYSNILGGLTVAGNGFGGISLAQQTSAANSYVVSGSSNTNYINMTYPYASLQLVSTIVSQLTQLGYGVGPDVGVDVAYSAGSLSAPVATVNLSYPRRGRTFAQNNLMVDLSTSFSYTFPEDGTQAANIVYEIGNAGAISVQENIYPIEQGYATLEVVKSRSNITTSQALSLLSEVGYSDLALLSYPVVVPQFTVDLFDPNLQLGSFVEGDDLLVYIPATDGLGNVFDPGFPQGMYLEWRITQYQCVVGDSGASTMTVTLNQPPISQATQAPLAPQAG